MITIMASAPETAAEEMIVGRAVDHPLLSIVIPTYRRHALLMEAVESAIRQDFDGDFEVVVVDDDPASDGQEQLSAALPEVAQAPFRYLRTRQNIGMFSNINRCVAEARGEWITILHDDDLIHRDFAREMFAVLEVRPEIDGLVCRKGNLDQREKPVGEGALKQLARRLVHFQRFGFSDTRRIDARKLFWGCIVGNVGGFICRTGAARSLGGFYTEEYPSADYYFYARFAHRYHFREFNRVLATYRTSVNVSMKLETQLAALPRNYQWQTADAGFDLPVFWSRFSPLLVARHAVNTARVWNTDIPRRAVSEKIGIEVPPERPPPQCDPCRSQGPVSGRPDLGAHEGVAEDEWLIWRQETRRPGDARHREPGEAANPSDVDTSRSGLGEEVLTTDRQALRRTS